MLANVMFDLPPIDISTHVRTGSGLWLSEAIATFVLALVVFGVVRSGRGHAAPFAVGAYIAAAYFFTSSTSFANPAPHLRADQLESKNTLTSVEGRHRHGLVTPFVHLEH